LPLVSKTLKITEIICSIQRKMQDLIYREKTYKKNNEDDSLQEYVD
jgi:hypothetical protein